MSVVVVGGQALETIHACMGTHISIVSCSLSLSHTLCHPNRSLLRQEVAFFDQNQTGELTNRLTGKKRGSVYVCMWMCVSESVPIIQPIKSEAFSKSSKKDLDLSVHGPLDSPHRFLIPTTTTADCAKISSVISLNINIMARQTIQLLGGMLFLFRINRLIALAAGGGLALLFLIAGVHGRFNRAMGEKIQVGGWVG